MCSDPQEHHALGLRSRRRGCCHLLDAADDRPFHFWTNNDRDRLYEHEYGDTLEDDASPWTNADTRNADAVDDVVNSARDLEDFFRVYIYVPTFVRNDPTVSLQLRWNAAPTSQTIPAINTFGYQANEGAGYLKSKQSAEFWKDADHFKRFGGSTTVVKFSPADLAKPNFVDGNGLIAFLVEGVAAGSGTLGACWVKNKRTVVRDDVRINLADARSMYDEFTNAYGGGVNVTRNWDFRSDPTSTGNQTVPTTAQWVKANHVPAMATTNDYFVFVHGWNVNDDDRVSSGNTAFKRLYWSGYKGRFATFTWPTGYIGENTTAAVWEPGNFDSTDYLALESAQALNDALKKIKEFQADLTPDNLDRPNNLTVLAHSHGNLVLTEALRTTQTQLVDNALLSQAAVSSDYFDAAMPQTIYTGPSPNPHVHSGVNNTRTYDGMPAVDGLGGFEPRFAPGKLKTRRLVNFANPFDKALAAWDVDQSRKTSLDVDANSAGSVTRLHDVFPNWLPGWSAMLMEKYRYFDETGYTVDAAGNVERRDEQLVGDPVTGELVLQPRTLSTLHATNPMPLGPTPANPNALKEAHEIMAFAAGSDGQAVGENVNLGAAQGFDDKFNLPLLSGKFDGSRAGHSAQFAHSLAEVRNYWVKVTEQAKE